MRLASPARLAEASFQRRCRCASACDAEDWWAVAPVDWAHVVGQLRRKIKRQARSFTPAHGERCLDWTFGGGDRIVEPDVFTGPGLTSAANGGDPG